MLNMFRTLIYPSSGACDYSAELPHWSFVVGSMCAGVSVCSGWAGVVSVLQAEASDTDTTRTNHTETPTHIEPTTKDQCGNSTE